MIRRIASGALLLSLALTIPAQAQEATEFSADERRRLLAGELVRRNISRREGANDLFGGASWQLVRAPIEEVWELVNDPRVYPHLIPSLREARVIEEDGATRLVYMRHDYQIMTTAYYARMQVDEENHSLRFRLDTSRPHDMRAGRGFISLSRYRGHTIVAWGMLADIGAGMIMQVFGPFLNEWLLLPPRCVRDELEPRRERTCPTEPRA
jgi:hypothetical protein